MTNDDHIYVGRQVYEGEVWEFTIPRDLSELSNAELLSKAEEIEHFIQEGDYLTDSENIHGLEANLNDLKGLHEGQSAIVAEIARRTLK